MRWVLFLILAYVVLLIQRTAGAVLAVPVGALGRVGPDLPAILAVYCALHVGAGVDAMLAGLVLGLGIDLASGTSGGGVASVGPMAVAYALGAGGVWRVREAVFGDRPLPQAMLALVFVAFTHGLWVTLQALRAGGASWGDYGELLGQVVLSAAYSAALAPLVCLVLRRIERWFLAAPATGRRRRR